MLLVPALGAAAEACVCVCVGGGGGRAGVTLLTTIYEESVG